MENDNKSENDRFTFGFPFVPYEIQTQLMRHLYSSVDKGKIAIVQSPTGTGKSLSILCSILQWLIDQRKIEFELVENDSSCPGNQFNNDNNNNNNNNSSSSSSNNNPNPNPNNNNNTTTNYDSNNWINLHFEQAQQKASDDIVRKRVMLHKNIKEILKKALLDSFEKDISKSGVSNTKFVGKRRRIGNPLDTDFILDDETTLFKKHKDSSVLKPDAFYEWDELLDTVRHDSFKCYGHRVFFCSRTHTQLSQILNQMRLTPFQNCIRTIPLASRKQMCINKSVNHIKSSDALNEACISLQKKKGLKKCPYLSSRENQMRFCGISLSSVYDIEDLRDIGCEIGACPYYGTREASLLADMVVLPYQLLLHSDSREATDLTIKDNIVVLDEGHNLIDVVNEIYSSCILLSQLDNVIFQLETYLERFGSKLNTRNLKYVRRLIYVAKTLLKWMSGKMTTKSKHEDVYSLHDFLFELRLDNLNLFKLDSFFRDSNVIRKVCGYVDFALRELSSEESCSLIPLESFRRFISILSGSDSDTRVIRTDNWVKILILNPGKHFASTVSQAKSVVLAGGTLEPFSGVIDPLFYIEDPALRKECTARLGYFSCDHVIPKENVLTCVFSSSPDKTKLSFPYNVRSEKHLVFQVGISLLNIFRVVPGGIIIFFPSRNYLNSTLEIWRKASYHSSSVFSKLTQLRKVFIEPDSVKAVESVFKDYSDCIDTNPKSAAIFCVVGGRLSEGINFTDNLCRCVMLVSLPYPNPKDLEMKEKVKFSRKFREINGDMTDVSGHISDSDFLQDLCMKSVNQSIGRAIRHADDYSVILLMDSRYLSTSIISRLPSWIRHSLRIDGSPAKELSFGQNLSLVASFFRSHENNAFSKPSSKLPSATDSNTVIIFTDGGASPNPGVGGYGAVLLFNNGTLRKELSAGYLLTTNNRMEMMAVLVALDALEGPSQVILHSDSKYIVDSINKQWVFGWRKRGWKKSDGKSPENVDLWMKILKLLEIHTVEFRWVKGHAGNAENERCDDLCLKARSSSTLLTDTEYSSNV